MRLHHKAILGLSLAAPVAAALFQVWVYQGNVQLGYRLSELERDNRRLQNERKQLEIETALQRSPARLLQMAQELSLAPSAPGQVVRVGGRDGAR